MQNDPLQQHSPKRRVRVGIDVGGTFTDVVVVDHETREVISQLKVPTTHSAAEGVALGIINGIEKALKELDLRPDEVIFIAHSTTQATNALLEGDVARVGVIGIGSGLEGLKARRDTKVPAMELAPGRYLNAEHRFISDQRPPDAVVDEVLKELEERGCEVIAISEAFGVDRSSNEVNIARRARDRGLFATAGHEVSSLYGLRTRTRTAVINGAILPKMIHTATMTDSCVRRAGIAAPLMIMRSDGGVMSVDEVHRRPIMTMLSGPAAGIAGALMYEKVSDGIFIEVGGTSADISVIRDGQPQTKAARVGGHRTYLNTLDVRTLAIAGGSMIREKNGAIVDVGPRSAHIAGLGYSCFQKPDRLDRCILVHLQPTEYDSDDYIAVETRSGERYALTPTCAANLLQIIPDDAFAFGDPATARNAFAPLAAALKSTVEDAARRVLEIACKKVERQIDELIKEYDLDRGTVELVGGGGGAASLVLQTGEIMGLPARLARKAEVISTIGVALAMVRDTIERNIVDPTAEQILQIRREAMDAVINIGAVPESVEVQIDVDTRRNLVTATAFGTTELKTDEDQLTHGLAGCQSSAARSMKVPEADVLLEAETASFYIFSSSIRSKSFFGLILNTKRLIRLVDKSGVVRLQRSNSEVVRSTAEHIERDLEIVVTKLTDFGDAGRSLPDIHLLVGRRIVDLSGLADLAQVITLAKTEFENLLPSEKLAIIASPKAN